MSWDARNGGGNESLKKWDIGAHPVNGINIDKAGKTTIYTITCI